MSRSVDIWVGKTDDTRPPPRVRLRVFDKYKGVCQLSKRKIMAGDSWDLDHRIALANGGSNDENNLQPVIRQEHRKKTASDVALKAKVERVRKKYLGIDKPKKPPSKYKRKIRGGTVLRETDE